MENLKFKNKGLDPFLRIDSFSNISCNKKVAVLGMGIEGLAMVNFLSGRECEISILDKLSEDKISERLSAEDKIKFSQIIENDKIIKIFGDSYLDNLSNFDLIFRSPGISFFNPKIQEAKKNGTLISSQIKLFFDLCPCKIIGVTGTKGKGTTATLIYEIISRELEANYSRKNPNDVSIPKVFLAGNIGYPAITLISKLKKDDFVILELSSFQLMDLEKSPQIAVVVNLLIDHLDYHKDIDEYKAAKESIIKFQNSGDIAILNKRSTFEKSVIDMIKSSIKYFSSSDTGDAVVSDDSVILDPGNRNVKICDKNSIELFGNHNLENIAAATLVADSFGISESTIKSVVSGFKGLPHRIEFVSEIDGIKFINDSFATNPEPTMAAIRSFTEDKILILGGSSKGSDFSQLAQLIADSNIKGVVLIGDEALKIEQALIVAAYSGKISKGLSDIDEIVRSAWTMASAKHVIILSPACASFGLFKNYKDRGDKFKAAVLKLQNKVSHESS